jgi:hypothetical protein
MTSLDYPDSHTGRIDLAVEPAPRIGLRAKWLTGHLWLVELATIASLALMSMVYARPLVEEWIDLVYFDNTGVGGYDSFARLSPLRPFGIAPTYLQWLIGGDPWGFGIGFALILAAKYFAARWAIAGHITGLLRWLVVVMATVLLPWPGEWLQRYGAAQVSVVMFWLAVGCTLRLDRRPRVGWIAAGASAILIMLSSYQGLTLCVLLLPLLAVIAGTTTIRRPWTSRRAVADMMSACAIPAIGLLAYAVYSKVAPHLFGTGSYESGLVNTRQQLHSVSGLWSLIAAAYDTAYVENPWTVVVLGALITGIVGPRLLAVSSKVQQNWAIILCALALALLPLLALPFAVNTGFLTDDQKVDLPVAVGFVVLVMAAVIRYPTPDNVSVRVGAQKVMGLIAVLLLISTALLGNQVRRFNNVQESTINQTARLLAQHRANSVVVWDYTGKLGDVYSLYQFQNTLSLALRARGIQVKYAVICTPRGVDRIQPYAQRFHWAQTPECLTLHPPAHTLGISAMNGPHGPVLRVG